MASMIPRWGSTYALIYFGGVWAVSFNLAVGKPFTRKTRPGATFKGMDLVSARNGLSMDRNRGGRGAKTEGCRWGGLLLG